MWPFILTRTLSSEKTIVASRSDVLKILHDPQQVLAHNPMVVSVVQDASNPSCYTITDRIPLVGSWAIHSTFKSKWKKVTDGCDVEVDAGLYTRLKNELRVRELNEGESSLEGTVLYFEKVEVQALFFSLPFVLSTIVKGHRDFMNTLAEKLEN